MRRLRLEWALLALLALAFTAAAASVTTKEIEEALTCQCGCGLTVHSCNHLQCGSGIPLKQVAQELGRTAFAVGCGVNPTGCALPAWKCGWEARLHRKSPLIWW